MASLNRVTLIGNLGRDPEFRSGATGSRFATFSIATSEQWKDKNSGEKKERTEWTNIVVFNEHLVPIIEKGSKLYVEGALQTRKWTDQAGVDRYSTEVVLAAFRGAIVLLDSQGSSGSRAPAPSSAEDYGSATAAPAVAPSSDRGIDDEIPF